MVPTSRQPQPLISARQLEEKVQQLAREIAADIDDSWMVVALLRGSFIFAADLVRQLHQEGRTPLVDFMAASSYGHNATSKKVAVSHDLKVDVKGRKVLIIDDIYDTGKTLQAVKQLLKQRGAKQIKTCVLLEKEGRQAVNIAIDHIGFKVPNQFVVGYGLDYAGQYRTLPYIGTLNA